MTEDQHYTFDLLARARQGDEEAAAAIIKKYTPQVLRVARRHLAPETRRILDSGDVVQSVWRSFFTHELPAHDFADDRELRQFLVRKSRRKTLDANRRYLDSQRLDLRRVCSLEELSSEVKECILDPGPSPAELSQAKDILCVLIASLSPRNGRIVVMLFEGYSHQEIAEEVGCTERTVERVAERIVAYIRETW